GLDERRDEEELGGVDRGEQTLIRIHFIEKNLFSKGGKFKRMDSILKPNLFWHSCFKSFKSIMPTPINFSL
ncbi:hypothetical protein ACQP3L_36960, partial [Escherichia coli]